MIRIISDEEGFAFRGTRIFVIGEARRTHSLTG